MSLTQRIKCLLYPILILIICGKGSTQTDSLKIYTGLAESAFLFGNIDRAASYYIKILDSPSIATHSDGYDPIKIMELLSICLKSTGQCVTVEPYIHSYLNSQTDKASMARVISQIIRCNSIHSTQMNPSLQKDISQYFGIQDIDTAAYIQLSDYLNGAYSDEKEFADFFNVVEFGFAPALASLEAEKNANTKAKHRSWIAMAASLLVLTLGFFLFTTNRQRQHVNREKVALLEGKEKETSRLSVDLHDILGYKIVELKDHISKLNNDKDQEILKLKNGLNELHESMRYIVQSNLTPESLKFGLAPALDTLFNRVNRLGVLHFDLYKHGLDNRVSPEMEKHIFYIIQELVNNAIKHSKGSKASFEVSRLKNEISILAEDNGIGYRPSVDTLKTIKIRTNHLNGKVIEESSIDNGATIIISIPT